MPGNLMLSTHRSPQDGSHSRESGNLSAVIPVPTASASWSRSPTEALGDQQKVETGGDRESKG